MGLRSANQRHASVLRGFATIIGVSGTVALVDVDDARARIER
jgi:hypothetical protein